MALPIHYRRVHGPATSDNLDDNFEVLATAVEDLQSRADDGVQIDTITLDDTGAALIITLTDARQFGPFPIGSGVTPMGDWAIGLAYHRGAIVSEDGSSYLCMIPHESVDLEDDLALGRWMILAAKGEGEGGGGGPSGPVPFHMSMLLPGAAAVGTYTRIVIPVACTLVSAGIQGRTRTGPGTGKSVTIAMAKYLAFNNDMVPTGQFVFSENQTTGFASMVPGGMTFVPGDVLEMGVFSASAGHEATDFGITFTFTPAE